MYHYFALTAVEAYLSVSGAYRMMPPSWGGGDSDDGFDYDEICDSAVVDGTRQAAVSAAVVSFLLLVLSAGWLTFSHFFNYQAVKRDHGADCRRRRLLVTAAATTVRPRASLAGWQQAGRKAGRQGGRGGWLCVAGLQITECGQSLSITTGGRARPVRLFAPSQPPSWRLPTPSRAC